MKKIIPIVIAIVVIIFIVVLVKNMIQVKNSDQPAATSTSQSNSRTNTSTSNTTSTDSSNNYNNTSTAANSNTNSYVPPTTTGGTTTTGSTTAGTTTGGTTTGGTTVGDPLDQKGLVNLVEARVISRTLTPFSKNNPKADVVTLQDFLKAKGYLAATAKSDGAYGNMTKAAVVRFQKANGISGTGNVGPITLKAINTTIVLEGKQAVN